MTSSNMRMAVTTIGILALLGCKPAPQQALKDVKVPAGFTFATSHGVDVSLTAAASALPASGKAALDIARADGKVLFRGQIDAINPVHLRLSVPLKDGALLATGSQSLIVRLPE